jgi:hypothetical protein
MYNLPAGTATAPPAPSFSFPNPAGRGRFCLLCRTGALPTLKSNDDVCCVSAIDRLILMLVNVSKLDCVNQLYGALEAPVTDKHRTRLSRVMYLNLWLQYPSLISRHHPVISSAALTSFRPKFQVLPATIGVSPCEWIIRLKKSY